ncbi:hypothetical protein [Paenibacillus sp. sgz500958]|uniref:hypothetical protein n=1 Tax=Paenibacillus sp. sgz500958 TaxID=3242475 RepID=UPI0036D295A9
MKIKGIRRGLVLVAMVSVIGLLQGCGQNNEEANGGESFAAVSDFADPGEEAIAVTASPQATDPATGVISGAQNTYTNSEAATVASSLPSITPDADNEAAASSPASGSEDKVQKASALQSIKAAPTPTVTPQKQTAANTITTTSQTQFNTAKPVSQAQAHSGNAKPVSQIQTQSGTKEIAVGDQAGSGEEQKSTAPLARTTSIPKSNSQGITEIGWSDFFDGENQTRPSERFWDLHGSTVTIKGFMGEVLSFEKRWFLLIPEPGAECPFDNGDETYWNKIMIVFVPDDVKLRHKSGPLQITGRLDVGIKIDESGYKTMFRLYDASFKEIE